MSGPAANVKNVYIDQSIGSGGTGTSVNDPYGDFESALAAETAQTNGTQFNIKSGTVINLTAEISGQLNGGSWGTNNSDSAPVIFRGYNAAANDGGKFEIVAATNTSCWGSQSMNYVSFVDGYMRDSGTASIINGNDYLQFHNMEFSGSSSQWGVLADNYAIFNNVHVHGMTGTYGIGSLTGPKYYNCFLDACSVYGYIGSSFDHCIFYNSGTAISIPTGGVSLAVMNCSFYGSTNAGGGAAIYAPARRSHGGVIKNSVFERYNYVLRETDGNTLPAILAGITYHDCPGGLTHTHANISTLIESVGASPFAKSGLATFANRANYFELTNAGNAQTGGYSPYGTSWYRGAVPFVNTVSGSGSYTAHPLIG